MDENTSNHSIQNKQQMNQKKGMIDHNNLYFISTFDHKRLGNCTKRVSKKKKIQMNT